MEENSGNREEKKVVLLCVMRWVPVRYSKVLKNYHVLSCDMLQIQRCAGPGTWPCTQGLWSEFSGFCRCRRGTASAQRHGRIKQHQQVTIVWRGKQRREILVKRGKYICLASLTDHVVFPAWGQWGVMKMHQISSLVCVFICDNTTSEKDKKTMHSTTVSLIPLSGAALIVCAVSQGFSCFLGLCDDLGHWVLPVVLWVRLGLLLAFPV